MAAEIVYTANPSREQLERYFRIRHDGYREVLGWRNFSGAEDGYDRQARFIIATHKGEVIGGIRLIIRESGVYKPLPLEEDGFVLVDLFPELHLAGKSYLEAGRLAVVAPFRKKWVTVGLFQYMVGLGQAHGCHYIFIVSPFVQARHYRQVFHGLGGNYEVQTTMMPGKPLYEGTPAYLGWLDLSTTPDYSRNFAVGSSVACGHKYIVGSSGPEKSDIRCLI